jgi:hypothetical protein
MTKNRKPLYVDGPKIIHEHLANQIDMDLFDFKDQLFRKTVHELFSVIKTQFYKKQSFVQTRKEILLLLNQEPYKECVNRCEFKGSMAAFLMSFCLKYKILFPIYLYSRF